jgi:hypothetical protein
MNTTHIEIRPLALPLSSAIEDWLAQRPNPATAWDVSLNREAHGRLLVLDVARATKAGMGWVAQQGARILGVATLEPLAWDTAHFGLSMHRLTHLIVGAEPSAAGHQLLSEVITAARERSIGHIQTTLDANRAHAPNSPHGGDTDLATLQAHGFQVRWGALRVMRHITAVPCDVTVPPQVRFEQATLQDLPALTEVVKRLSPYNWLELDPTLPLTQRKTYVQARLRGCIETDFADLCLIAYHRDRPLGFNASKFMTHDPRVQADVQWSYERDTFVAPEAPPGLGSLMVRAVSDRLSPSIRYIRGRIRINGVAMLRVVRQAGYDVEGGDYLLTWANEKEA